VLTSSMTNLRLPPVLMRRSFRSRLWLAYFVADLPFVPSVGAAFAVVTGASDDPRGLITVAQCICMAWMLRTVVWTALLWALLPVVDKVSRAYQSGTGAELRNDEVAAAMHAIDHFPSRFVVPYALMWGAQYAAIIAAPNLHVATRYPLGIALFAFACCAGAAVFNFSFNHLLLHGLSGKLSLDMRARKLTRRAWHLPFWATQIALMLGLVTASTGWLLTAAAFSDLRTDEQERIIRAELLVERLRDALPLTEPIERIAGGLDVDASTTTIYVSGGAEPHISTGPLAHQTIAQNALHSGLATGTSRFMDDVVLHATSADGSVFGVITSVRGQLSSVLVYVSLYFFAVVLLFTPIVTWLASRTFASPLDQLGDTLVEVSSRHNVSDLARVPAHRLDEVGNVAARANDMIDRLEQAFRTEREQLRLLGETNQELKQASAELERNNDALVQAARAKSQFLASMSHELRTPLNAIIGFSRMVLKKTQGMIPEQQSRNLKLINESGQSLLALVNDLLDFERVESGRLNLVVVDVDCNELVSSLHETLKPIADKKGLALHVHVASAPVVVRTDVDRLRQVMVNFINNAIKYSEHGTIDVRVLRASNGDVQLEVRDQGVGIPAAELQNIFEPFHQVDGTFAREREGVGLGLAIVRKLVELMGARIEVASEVGQGSMFTVILPASIVVGAMPAADPISGNAVVVLVIEDDAATLSMLQQQIEPAGFRVRSARNYDEALAQLAVALPTAMVLDLSLPRPTPQPQGTAILEHLRQMPGGDVTLVVVYTALDLPNDERRRLDELGAVFVRKGDAGADVVLEKLRRGLRKSDLPAPTIKTEPSLSPFRADRSDRSDSQSKAK
jgi:signal transduction histidine kinase/DNA-binding NarL/FixJ family response regulator